MIKKSLFYSVLFFSLCVLDRVTKNLAIKYWQNKPILYGMNLSFSFNKGVSFGLFSSYAANYFWLISIFVLSVFFIFLFYVAIEARRGSNLIGEILVISGALSNLLDRLVYMGVVDFIDLYLGSYHWPTFNLADSYIVVGITFIVIKSIYYGYSIKN